MARKKISKDEAKQQRDDAKRAPSDITWMHRVQRGYAAKHGGYWRRAGHMVYDRATKKWHMEGSIAQRILTKEEARTVVRRALALVKQALYESNNGDDQFSPEAYEDKTYHGKRAHYHDKNCTYGKYRKDKADHAEDCVKDVWDTDGIYAMALRIEAQANYFYDNLSSYMWNPYEEYDPARGSETAYGVITSILYTAITGEDIGKTLKFNEDEFNVIDYTEELDSDVITEEVE